MIKKSIFSIILFVFFSASVFAQNRLTPELLWKLGRVSIESVSPNGSEVVYGVTYYDLNENKGERDLYKVNIKSEKVIQITDEKGSEHSAIYSKDGKKVFFQKSGQLWVMNADGSSKSQITSVEGGASNYKISPKWKIYSLY